MINASSSRGQKFPPGGRTDVMLRIEKNFEQWDRDGNGRIAWSEIRDCVADPSIEGKDAAALCTLYKYVEADASKRGLTRKASVTSSTLSQMRDSYLEGALPELDTNYRYALYRLENSTDEVFPDGLPNAFHVAQGAAPSCSFLSVTFAQAQSDPNVISDAVQAKPDGTYDVTFPGLGKTHNVTAPTDTETTLFASSSKNGTWLNLLEKAFGQQVAPKGAHFESRYNPATVIEAWTGDKAKITRIPKTLKNYRKGQMPAFLRTSSKQLASNNIVVTWTKFDSQMRSEGYVPGHAYAVMGIDQDDGLVELANPWGYFEPTGDNGRAKDGRDDGRFKMTIPEFVDRFGYMARQLG